MLAVGGEVVSARVREVARFVKSKRSTPRPHWVVCAHNRIPPPAWSTWSAIINRTSRAAGSYAAHFLYFVRSCVCTMLSPPGSPPSPGTSAATISNFYVYSDVSSVVC